MTNKFDRIILVITIVSFVSAVVLYVLAAVGQSALDHNPYGAVPTADQISRITERRTLAVVYGTWAGVGAFALLVVGSIRFELSRLRVRIDA